MKTAERLPVHGRLADALRAVQVVSGMQVRVDDDMVEAHSPRALVPALGAALYAHLHLGRPHDPAARPNTRDLPLEDQLAAAVPHSRTPVRAVVRDRGTETHVVELSGVRVRVPVVRVGELGPDGTAEVTLDPARPALSPGFFLVDGSAGTIHGGGPILRVYLHLTDAGAAPAALGAALGVLEQRAVPYRAKVLSQRGHYPRRDALVIYLEGAGLTAVPELVAALDGLSGVAGATSPYTHRAAPGLAMAWDPVDERPGFRGLSFGEHRSRAVAEGVVEHAVTGAPLLQAVAAGLLRAGVDPAAPHRNIGTGP